MNSPRRNNIANILKSHPLPALRDVKRHFICNADRLIFSNLLIRQIIGKAQDSNLCVSRYRNKTVKWILSALPFFFLSKIVKSLKLYSKSVLRIPISVGAFKIFCKTAFLWFYKWKSNKIYILKLGSSTKFENLVAKHPF